MPESLIDIDEPGIKLCFSWNCTKGEDALDLVQINALIRNVINRIGDRDGIPEMKRGGCGCGKGKGTGS